MRRYFGSSSQPNLGHKQPLFPPSYRNGLSSAMPRFALAREVPIAALTRQAFAGSAAEKDPPEKSIASSEALGGG